MNEEYEQLPKETLNIISKICTHFDTKDFQDDVINIVEEIYDKKLYNGRSKKSMIGGVFYTVLKQNNVPISAYEISQYLDIDKRSLILTNKYISNNLSKFSALPTDWKSYIQYFDDQYEIDDNITDLSYEIGELGVKNSYLSGKKPQSYAASCLYAASKISETHTSITQRKLCDALDISSSTIRASYNNLVELYNNNDK